MQGANLKFHRFVKSNWQLVSGVLYFINLEAADAAGVVKRYRAQVWNGITEDELVYFALAPPQN